MHHPLALPRVCLGVVGLTLVLGSARAEPASPNPKPLSPAIPVAGGLLAAGGLALSVAILSELKDGNPGCSDVSGDCFWGAQATSVLTLVGGAAIAGWSWRQGEVNAAEDLAAGTVTSHGTSHTVALIVAGAALATSFGAAVYSGVRAGTECTPDGTPDRACASRNAYGPGVVSVAATPVLLAAASWASYAWGYDRYAARARREGARSAVFPLVAGAGSAGLAWSLTF